MKYLKKFERIKTDRPINIGDEVIWIGRDRKIFKNSYVPEDSEQAKYGDKCIITQLKTIKGEIYTKAKNIESNEMICSFLDASKRKIMPYNPDGYWWKFDRFFKHELDQTLKKYNI